MAVVAGQTGLWILATAQTYKFNLKWSEKEEISSFFHAKNKKSVLLSSEVGQIGWGLA